MNIRTFSNSYISPAAIIVCAVASTSADANEGNIEAGRQKAVLCQACHGPDGNSVNPTYPVLAGQHARYIVKQLKAFKAGTRKDPVMNGMALSLSQRDMLDVAAYFASVK